MKSFLRSYSPLTWAFVAVLGVFACFSVMGAPLVSPDILATLTVGGAVLVGDTASIGDLKKLLDDQGSAWESFKKSNDERLKAIESKGYAPADVVEKVDKANAEVTRLCAEIQKTHQTIAELEKRQARPGATGKDRDLPAEAIEHRKALSAWMRTGNGRDELKSAEAKAIEVKALTSQSDPDGGFLTSPEMDSEIDRVASVETMFASLATERKIGKATYKKLVKTRGVSGGWAGETSTNGETNAPQWSEIEINAVRVEAEPWVYNEMLEDSDYDLESDLTDEVGITFGELEGNAFINGTGVKQPRGILSYTNVANASYAWGKVGYIATGVSADFAASNKADKIIDLQHSLKQRYRPGAVFLTSDATLAVMRQFKDSSGSYYLWNPDPARGPSGTFLGSPVVVDDYMPVIAANSYSVAYGNFKRAYTIVRRRGIALIRDNLTTKGTTKFNFSRRTGGGITNFEAVKLLKFGTS